MFYQFLLSKIFGKRSKLHLVWILGLVFLSPVAAIREVREFLGIQTPIETNPAVVEEAKQLKNVVAKTVSRILHPDDPQAKTGTSPTGTSSTGTQTTSTKTTPDLPTGAQPAGPIRIYFTKPGSNPDDNDIAHAVVKYINATKTTLDVAAFELDNKIIVDALVAAAKRGVRVRLVTETSYVNESGVLALSAVGVPVVDDRRDGALMHNKFMVFDNKAVWMGSMNFTENCAYRNNNHGIFFDIPALAVNYSTKFSWMFEKHKFGGLPSRDAHIPYPILNGSDGTVIENYFSTHDHIANHLIEKINQAKLSIHFLAFSFTHEGMGQAMLRRAQAGLPVLGVFEKQQTTGGYSQYDKMKSFGANVHVYLDANPRNMHHKVIILDAETTVAGSFNFSENADKHNDENIVIIKNRDVARQFEEEFQRVYQAAGGGQLVGSAR